MKLTIKNSNVEIAVENVYCIGMNYIDHAKELGNKLPEKPVVFLKSNSTITKSGRILHLPDKEAVVHYEGELVVIIKQDCSRVDEKTAEEMILGYAVGIDYTLREIQNQAKKKGRPWTMSKNFYGAAPISDIILKENIPNLMEQTIYLTVNEQIRQQDELKLMIFKIPYLISYLSHHLPLKQGDIIFTGTPKGVGQVASGDEVKCWVEGVGELISYVQ